MREKIFQFSQRLQRQVSILHFSGSKETFFPAQKRPCTLQKSHTPPAKEPNFLEKAPVSPANSATNSLPYFERLSGQASLLQNSPMCPAKDAIIPAERALLPYYLLKRALLPPQKSPISSVNEPPLTCIKSTHLMSHTNMHSHMKNAIIQYAQIDVIH